MTLHFLSFMEGKKHNELWLCILKESRLRLMAEKEKKGTKCIIAAVG